MLDVERRNNISLYVGTESRNIGTPVHQSLDIQPTPLGDLHPNGVGGGGGAVGQGLVKVRTLE